MKRIFFQWDFCEKKRKDFSIGRWWKRRWKIGLRHWISVRHSAVWHTSKLRANGISVQILRESFGWEDPKERGNFRRVCRFRLVILNLCILYSAVPSLSRGMGEFEPFFSRWVNRKRNWVSELEYVSFHFNYSIIIM